MSSAMMNMMLGFDVACAIALDAGSADAVASAASAAPAVRVVRHKLIAISSLVAAHAVGTPSTFSRRAASGVSPLETRRMHPYPRAHSLTI
jgi:hypothetical protein